jgi:DNA-binding NarL/FixJ family response regulator
MGTAHEGKTRSKKSVRSRVFVVDDHEVVRRGFELILQRTDDLVVCGEAGNAQETLTRLPQAQADVVVMDLNLRGVLGFDLIGQVREGWPTLPVLVVSVHDEVAFGWRCVQAGASGYLAKEQAAEEIAGAIRRVLAGEIFLSERVATQVRNHLVDTLRAGERPAEWNFSNREWQVFVLLGKGQSNKEIAEALAVDVRTVETYRGRLKAKLGLPHGSNLPRLAVEWAMDRSTPSVQDPAAVVPVLVPVLNGEG